MIHENNLIYFLETVTQGSEMISPNSFCGFIFARAIDMDLEPPFLYNRSGKNDSWKQFDLFLGNCNTRFWNDISQLILWIYLHKGHRYDLRPPVSLQPVEQEWSKKNIIPLKLCSFAEGSEIISANSFCGFTFARAIDMNLDPPFLCNRSGKNDSWKQFDLFLGNCNTRFWNDISQLILWIYLRKGHKYELRPTILLQPKWPRRFEIFFWNWKSFSWGSEMISSNSFCGFIFARAIDMNLEPPFLYNRSGKNDSWKQFDIFLGNCNTRFWNDISQLILWIYLHKGHRYELRPPVSLQPVEQEWSKKNIIPLKLCSFAEGSEIIFANSLCGFTFARAIDMNLDPPFLCNRSGKNYSWKQFDLFLGKCNTRFWNSYLPTHSVDLSPQGP